LPGTGPQTSQKLSFARTQIEAHGVEVGARPVVLSQNFVVDAAAAQPLSQPNGDVYLSFMGIGASAPGDTVLSLTTLPGLIEAYRSMGLLHPSTTVFEVSPLLDTQVTGYPHTSPLERLVGDSSLREDFSTLFNARERPIFVGTFLTTRMRRLLKDIDCDFVQHASPALTNNKHRFGFMSSTYGYSTMPHVLLEQQNDVTKAAQLALEGLQSQLSRGTELADSITVAWMKLSGGSGGDFVQKISIPREDATSPDSLPSITRAIEQARERLYASTKEAFVYNDYGDGALESFWPTGAFSPSKSSIIIEQDIRARGEVRANASNLMVLNADGTYTVEGSFRQITGADGDYRGSMPFDPRADFPSGLVDSLEANLAGIARYAHELNLRGFIGVDFFIVESHPGNFEVVMTELNGRIPISGASKIMADKIGAPAWINVNLDLPAVITSYEDFETQVGELSRFSPGDFSSCKIIPQAFRTLYDGDTMVPSGALKALIVGPSQAACMACLEDLSSSGLGK